MKNMKKQAFTLAEVLITLTIIGVVAAVTVPTLTKKTGNQEYVSRLQKVYSTLSQATDSIMLEKGEVPLWALDANTLYDNYKEYLRNAKDCGSSEGCFKSMSGNNTAKLLNGSNYKSNFNSRTDFRKLILSDGTNIGFLSFATCDTNEFSERYGIINRCAEIWVDINGDKKPNTIGRDIFAFALKKDGLYPFGADAENIDDVCNVTGYGHGCAFKIITEGEMNY